MVQRRFHRRRRTSARPVNFLQGKLNEHDEGELRMAVASDPIDGVVRIVFGKPVAWLGLPVLEARALAALITEKANELSRPKEA